MVPGLQTSSLTHRSRRVVLMVFILPVSLWLLASNTGARAGARTVLVAEVDGIITPVIADHLREGVARAEEENHHAFLVELDTPGGLDASMRDIIETFLGADVPVVVDVVDLLAPNRTALLEAIDGETVTLAAGRRLTLETRDVQVVSHELGTFRSILQWLADPNLAFLFMSLGTLAIIYELANPGFGGGAIVGVILI